MDTRYTTVNPDDVQLLPGAYASTRALGGRPRGRLLSGVAAVALALGLSVAACDGDGAEMTAMTMEEDDGGESTGEPEPPPPECEPGGGEPTLLLGDGSAGFLDTGEVELVLGPQGGYHIVLGVQATFIDASGELSAEITGAVDGEVLGTCSPSVVLACNRGAPALETSGILLIWDPGVTPEQLDGQTATVELTLTDAEGFMISASRDFVITLP